MILISGFFQGSKGHPKKKISLIRMQKRKLVTRHNLNDVQDKKLKNFLINELLHFKKKSVIKGFLYYFSCQNLSIQGVSANQSLTVAGSWLSG